MLFYNSTSFATEALKAAPYIILRQTLTNALADFLTQAEFPLFVRFHHIFRLPRQGFNVVTWAIDPLRHSAR